MSAATFSTLIFDQMLRAPRREALEKVLVVEALLLAVDPAPAESALHRLGVGDAGLIGAPLGDLEPEAAEGGVMLLQPAPERLGALEQGRGGARLTGGFGGGHRMESAAREASAARAPPLPAEPPPSQR